MAGDLITGKQNVVPDDIVNWNVVGIVIDKYAERYPEEMIGCVDYVLQMRKKHGPMDSFGIVEKDTQRRHMYEMPPRLMGALTVKYPLLLTGRNLNKFLKKYPVFRVTEKI